MTFAWMTWEVTRDPLALGYLGLAQGVPLIAFQLWGGVLADRMNRLKLLIGTQTLTAVTIALAFGLTVLGQIRFGHLLALAAASSVFRAFDEPARLSPVPALIDRPRLPNGIALGSMPWQAGRMIGPSITGILIAAFGGAVGFGIAAAAAFLALAYSRIRIAGDPAPNRRQHALPEFAEGFTAVWGDFVFAAFIDLALFYLTQVSTFIQQNVAEQFRGRVGGPSTNSARLLSLETR